LCIIDNIIDNRKDGANDSEYDRIL
jgi:hypothetical protein